MATIPSGLNVAIVYDRVNKWGGAERFLLSLHKVFPNAPLYTSVYDSQTAKWADVFPQIFTSPLNRFPYLRNRHELVPFLMPFAFESFNFSKYDLVISVTSSEAKGIITPPSTCHLCICLTPTRYLYVMNPNSSYHHFARLEIIAKFFKPPLLSLLRRWDQVAKSRPDAYVAISKLVHDRITRFYSQPSSIVYPPLDSVFDRKVVPTPGNYYLSVGRLVGYKKLDLLIHTANTYKLPLKIVGVGPHLKYLQQISGETVQFGGQVSESQLSQLYLHCKALIVPGEEEFCLASLEAQAHGKPVVAFSESGVSEIILDGVTGILFTSQTQQSLIEAIKKLDRINLDVQRIKANAQRFSFSKFKTNLLRVINVTLKNHAQKFN